MKSCFFLNCCIGVWKMEMLLSLLFWGWCFHLMTAKPRENTNVFREMGTSQCPTISKHTSDYLPTSPTILGDALYINVRIFQVISFKKRNAPAIHYETTAFIYTTSLNPSNFFFGGSFCFKPGACSLLCQLRKPL